MNITHVYYLYVYAKQEPDQIVLVFRPKSSLDTFFRQF